MPQHQNANCKCNCKCPATPLQPPLVKRCRVLGKRELEEVSLDSYSCPHTVPKLANCQSELLSWFAYYAKVSFVPSFVGSLHSCLLRFGGVCSPVRSWVIKTLKDASVRDKSCFSLFTWRRRRREEGLWGGGVAGQVEPSAVVRQT